MKLRLTVFRRTMFIGCIVRKEHHCIQCDTKIMPKELAFRPLREDAYNRVARYDRVCIKCHEKYGHIVTPVAPHTPKS